MSPAGIQATRVCTVVADLDKVVGFYRNIMGMDGFTFEDVAADDARWGNVAAPGRWRVASAPFGQAEMEAIEVLSGRPPHLDFIEKYGEGMNHVCWETPDGDAYSAQMLKLGLEAGMWPYWGYPEAGFAYVNSEKDAGGVAVEVIRARRGFNHFGIAVKNRDRTAAFLRDALNFGSFDDRDFPGRGFLYNGARIDATFRVGFTRIGECRLDFIQPLEGDTSYARQLASRGEGLHHLRIDVPNMDAAVAQAAVHGAMAEWACPSLGQVQLNSRAIGGMTVTLASA